MIALATYIDRDSLVHRAPAGAKLAVLAALAVVSVLLQAWWQVVVLLAVVVAAYPLARLPVRVCLAQVRPLALILVAIGAFQVVVAGWERAVLVCGSLAGLVALAGLVSLTTRTDDLVAVVVALAGPVRRLGLDPERLGLLVSLGIRTVPVIVALARQVREAQIARGARSRPVAFLIPLVIASLRHADQVGEALVARGATD